MSGSTGKFDLNNAVMLDWCSVLDQYSNISSSQECGGRHLMMRALLYQPRGLEQNSLGQLELTQSAAVEFLEECETVQ